MKFYLTPIAAFLLLLKLLNPIVQAMLLTYIFYLKVIEVKGHLVCMNVYPGKCVSAAVTQKRNFKIIGCFFFRENVSSSYKTVISDLDLVGQGPKILRFKKIIIITKYFMDLHKTESDNVVGIIRDET